MNTERNELILSIAAEGFWDWDVKTDQTYLSPRYCELLGYPPDDTVFNSHFFKKLIHPDDLSRVSDLHDGYLQGTHTASVVEYRTISKNGTVRWIEERAKVVEFDAAGIPSRMIGTVIDITQRKEIEKQLQQSEEKFSTAFRSSPDSININRLNDGMYLEINEGFTAITGYTTADAIGKTSLELNIWADPHDRSCLVEGLKGRGVVNNLEARFRRKDGSILTGFMSARIIEIEGEACILSITRDITERKRAEDELRRDKALLRCIIDSISDLIFVKDADGVYQACNKASEGFIGLPECEQIGKSDFDLFSRDVAEVIREYDRQIMASSEESFVEEWVTHRDGSRRLLDTVKTPFYGQDGKVLGLVGISRDVTERKQAATMLRESETQLRAILQSTADGILAVDTHGKLLHANHQFAKLWRIPETLMESVVEQVLLDYVVDQLLDPEAFIRKVMILNVSMDIDFDTLSFKDGRVFERYSCPLITNGAITGRVWSFRDITEQKQADDMLRESEERHRTILHTAMDGFWLMDVQGQILEVNETLCRMCGYSAQELHSKRVSDLEAFESDDDVRAHFQKIMANGEDRFESRLRRKDGSVYDVEVSAQYRPIDGGRIVAFLRDITTRKHAEIELQKKNIEIEQFIYTVSHDLRTPLVTVKSFLGFLENDMNMDNRERVSQDLSFIHNAADKMKLLLDELLELSRIDRVETPPVRVSLKELTTEVMNTLAGIISERSVYLEQPETDLMLIGDRQRFFQIWQNLIENAIKYSSDDRPPRIELGVQLDDSEAVFFVKDNGIGIDPQYHNKIFGIFEKLDPKSPGAGLGLSMVLRIVEKCGGRIWVESEGVGKGTCVYFTLPHAFVQN